jgi:hypothetical protein
LLSERAARALVDFNNRKILCRRRFGDSRGDGIGERWDRRMSTEPTVDDVAQLCAALARDEAREIMEEIKPRDLTACEIVALLTIIRPAWERKQAEQRNPAPVLKLVRSDTRQEP